MNGNSIGIKLILKIKNDLGLKFDSSKSTEKHSMQAIVNLLYDFTFDTSEQPLVVRGVVA